MIVGDATGRHTLPGCIFQSGFTMDILWEEERYSTRQTHHGSSREQHAAARIACDAAHTMAKTRLVRPHRPTGLCTAEQSGFA